MYQLPPNVPDILHFIANEKGLVDNESLSLLCQVNKCISSF